MGHGNSMGYMGATGPIGPSEPKDMSEETKSYLLFKSEETKAYLLSKSVDQYINNKNGPIGYVNPMGYMGATGPKGMSNTTEADILSKSVDPYTNNTFHLYVKQQTTENVSTIGNDPTVIDIFDPGLINNLHIYNTFPITGGNVYPRINTIRKNK